MNFERGKDIKARIGIGRYTEEALIIAISEALSRIPAYKEYVLQEGHYGSVRKEWIAPSGGYIYLHKTGRNRELEDHPKLPGYHISYDDGGFSYGHLSLLQFFKDFNIEL